MLSSRIYLSRSAFSHNIALFRKLIGPKTKFTAIIKSNAYGHGLLATASIALDAGADYLGVNSLEEALSIRRVFTKATILIMGSIPDLKERKESLADENFWVMVSRIEEMEILAKLSPTPKIHLKVDTGMSRLGIPVSDADALAKEIFEKNSLFQG